MIKRLAIPLTMAATLCAPQARGHARFDPAKSPAPRSTNSGIKNGPCGSDAVTVDAKRTWFKPGQEVTIYWEETIDHPGWFRIAFSEDGATGFDANVLKDNITDTQNTPVNYSDPATYHKYSTKVTLPNEECDKCALQLIQYMTENPASPSLYFSCADIKISTQDPPPAATEAAAPTGLKIEVKKLP